MHLNYSFEKRQKLTNPVFVQFKTQRLKIFFRGFLQEYDFYLKWNDEAI